MREVEIRAAILAARIGLLFTYAILRVPSSHVLRLRRHVRAPSSRGPLLCRGPQPHDLGPLRDDSLQLHDAVPRRRYGASMLDVS